VKTATNVNAGPRSLHLKQANAIHVKVIIAPAAAAEKHLAVFASNLYE
jgi:hypothetical protein